MNTDERLAEVETRVGKLERESVEQDKRNLETWQRIQEDQLRNKEQLSAQVERIGAEIKLVVKTKEEARLDSLQRRLSEREQELLDIQKRSWRSRLENDVAPLLKFILLVASTLGVVWVVVKYLVKQASGG